MRPLRTRLELVRKKTGMSWAVLERDYLAYPGYLPRQLEFEWIYIVAQE